jgi:hypothetical protein
MRRYGLTRGWTKKLQRQIVTRKRLRLGARS